MKKTYVQINGILYERVAEPDERVAPDVMPDIKPYKSMLTGEIVNSRSRHREHLRERGYVEVGNDSSLNPGPYKGIPDAQPEQRKELIRSQIDRMTWKQFRQAGKQYADLVKWNSRER